MKEAIAERYKGLVNLNESESISEMTAAFLEEICGGNDYVGERASRILLEKSPNAFKKIVQFFKDKVNYYKQLISFDLTKSQKLELQASEKALKNLERGLKAYRNGKAEAPQGVRYSINPDFARKYDQWDKQKIGFQFLIGTTSKPLQSIGINDKKIYWDSSKIKKIKEKHIAMTDDVIKQVPNILEYPILVMESQTVNGRLTIFGDVYDAKGSPVLTVLELNPIGKDGHTLDIIKVASAYGKRHKSSKIDR